MKQGPSKSDRDSSEWQAPDIFKTSDFFGEDSLELSTGSLPLDTSEKQSLDLPSEEQTEENCSVNR